MNIAFFTNNYRPFVGGVPIAIDLLRQQLRKRGHKVYVFAPDYNQVCDDEIDVFRFWSITNFNNTEFAFPLPLTLEPYLQLSDLQIDVVHVHHPFLLGETGLHAARAQELPVVFTYHTQYEKYAHYLPFGERMVGEVAIGLATRFCNSCDAIIAPSGDVKQTLLERGVTVPVRVIPTGVDLQRFRRGNNRWLRQKFQIPEQEKVLLFVSRLAKEKNVGFLLEAFHRMLSERQDMRLVLVGGGDDEAELKQQAETLGISDHVVFTGLLSGDDLISAYKGADVFVFASTSETQGMVVLEAMAGGSPVVAVDAPGVRDVVLDGKNGVLVQESDVEGFARHALEVLGNKELASTLRNGARERARQLSLSRTTQKVEDTYKFVMRNPHPERDERFMLLREFFRYQFNRLTQQIEAIIP